jgi:hypothetical protein
LAGILYRSLVMIARARALITSVAVLFLAIGTAHAQAEMVCDANGCHDTERAPDLAFWCNNPETQEQCEIFKRARFEECIRRFAPPAVYIGNDPAWIKSELRRLRALQKRQIPRCYEMYGRDQ